MEATVCLVGPYSRVATKHEKYFRTRVGSSFEAGLPAWRKLRSLYEKAANFPPSWTSLKTEKWHWVVEDGTVAFTPVDRTLVVAGEPIGLGSKEALLAQFLSWANRLGLKATGYYVSVDLKSTEVHKVYCGTSSLIALEDFKVHGKDHAELRRAYNRGHKRGLEIEKLDSAKLECSLGEILNAFKLWRKEKGLIRIGFLLSDPQEISLTSMYEQWWVCRDQGEVGAFLTLLPYKLPDGSNGVYVDQFIQNPMAYKYSLDYLLANCLEILSKSDVSQVSLGLNPFASCSFCLGTEGLLWTLGRLEPIYNSRGLRYFKNKFKIGTEVPRYLWRSKDLSPLQSWIAIGRATFSIYKSSEMFPEISPRLSP